VPTYGEPAKAATAGELIGKLIGAALMLTSLRTVGYEPT
jgi:hypothetical protein